MKKLFVLGIVLLLTLTACSSLFGNSAAPTQDVQAAIAGTLAVQNAIGTMTAQTAAAQVVIPPTEIPTIAVPPTSVPPTVAPVSLVKATANKNANCRSGPAANFDYIGVLSQGATADVIGKNTEFGKWWKVKLADGSECWVVDDAVTLAGDTGSLALLESPKTPTPKPPPSWAGNWTLYVSNGNYGASINEIVSMATTISQSGNSLTFSYRGWGMDFTSNGTLSANGLTFNGYEGGSYGWNSQLYWIMDPNNPNQFRGKWYTGGGTMNDGPFCGSRNGAPMPSPCRP
jgi:hypothetical protein